MTLWLIEHPTLNLREIGIVFDGDTRWLWDGHQRVAAYQGAGRKMIDASVVEGDWLAALDLSRGANGNRYHGLRRSNYEVIDILAACLADPRIKDKSLREIANLVGCSHEAVRRFKKSIEDKQTPPVEIPPAPDHVVVKVEPESAPTTPPPSVAAKVEVAEEIKKELMAPPPIPPPVIAVPLTRPDPPSDPEELKRIRNHHKAKLLFGQLINVMQEMGRLEGLRAELSNIKVSMGF